MLQELYVIKIGGYILDNEKLLSRFLSDFASLPSNKVLIHGGGKLATELSHKLGIETKMIDGRRVTDEDTIRIVTMTYAGWINKSITAKLQTHNCPALGLSGVDAQLIPAVKRPIKNIDYGWVGDVLPGKINVSFFKSILEQNMVPVIAPISCNDQGQLLNINADTIAQYIAESLSPYFATTLVYCFEKNGLLENVQDDSTVISEISLETAADMKQSGTITSGMLPKIDNAFQAIKNGVQTVMIGNALHVRQLALKLNGYGTRIKA